MKLKHAIIETMDRDLLKAVCDDLEIDGIDRRSRDDMAAAVSRARQAKPEELIEYLSEKQVKAVCELMRVEARGRRNALIEQLLNGADAGASASASGAEKNNGRVRRARTERSRGNDAEEEVSWMSADELKEKTATEHMQSRPLKSVPRRAGQEITRAELVWPGKYDDAGNVIEPPRLALPFQVIEVIEAGRASREALTQGTLPLFGERPRGPEEDGWRNKLIWGDNLLVMGSLIEEFAGKVDLIYIDPPFALGADFSFRTRIGESDLEIEKEPSAIEMKTYRDTWGRGFDSYLTMIAQRLHLMRDLLSPTGTIYVHVGPTVSHYVRCVLEDVFGASRFVNEIVWRRAFAHNDPNRCGQIHDTILVFQKGDTRTWNPVFQKPSPEYIEQFFDQYDSERGERYNRLPLDAPRHGDGGNLIYEWKGVWPAPNRTWAYPREKMEEFDRAGRIHYPKRGGVPRLKRFESEYEGAPIQDIWTDIHKIHNQSSELLGYNTQKPEALLERIITASSNPGDLVADFFCGSGTTVAVAERLGRRWIGCDIGRFAIHTVRKRLLSLRTREPKTGVERGCGPFEILNLGRYERRYWQGSTFGFDESDPKQAAIASYVLFVLQLYNAQPVAGRHVHGMKGVAFVHVGAVDAPVTIAQVELALLEAKARGARELHVLGWEWEMGLHDPLAKMAKTQHGVTLRLLNIPREVMDRRAVDAGDVQFFDLAYLEVDVRSTGKGSQSSRRIKVKLKDFVIPNSDLIPDEVRNKIRKWSDYIDYWAVDWDFRDDTFVNQWQTYRTRRDRSLAIETPEHTYEAPGKYRILVKVVDIFGNDTSHLLEWEAK